MHRGSLVVSLRVQRALDHIELAAAAFLPALVGTPAEVAGAGRDPLGMESGVLIQTDGVGSMRGAKDVTAMTAVMTAEEETEGGTTGGRVTI